jgi:cell division protein FtsB
MRSHYLRFLLLAAYASFSAYCLLSLFLGPAGLIAYARLSENRAEMLSNLEELRGANDVLKSELAALRSDADRVEREARALGYLAPGEMALVLGQAGSTTPPPRFEAGSVVLQSGSAPLGDAAIKEISLIVGLVALCGLIARDLGQSPALGRLGRQQRNRKTSQLYY